jgi:hypothetical protein
MHSLQILKPMAKKKKKVIKEGRGKSKKNGDLLSK